VRQQKEQRLEKEIAEEERHNRAMEEIERTKAAQSSTQRKAEELNLRMQLVRNYKELTEQGFSHDWIAASFPEMISTEQKSH
jgi:hypothetical protein